MELYEISLSYGNLYLFWFSRLNLLIIKETMTKKQHKTKGSVSFLFRIRVLVSPDFLKKVSCNGFQFPLPPFIG